MRPHSGYFFRLVFIKKGNRYFSGSCTYTSDSSDLTDKDVRLTVKLDLKRAPASAGWGIY